MPAVLASALVFLVSIAGMTLSGAAPARAESRIGTSVTIMAGNAVLLSPTATTTVSGYLLKAGSGRLKNGTIVIRAYSATTGQLRLTTLTKTGPTGLYRIVLKAGVSLRLIASFPGSPSYAPSASPPLGVSVESSSVSSPVGSSVSPKSVTGPLVTALCNEYGKLISRSGGEAVGETGGVILGATGDQVAQQCKGKNPEVLKTYLDALKGVPGRVGGAALGRKVEVLGLLTELHRAMGIDLKSSSVGVRNAYLRFALDSYDAVSSIIDSCLQLPTTLQAADCTNRLVPSLQALYSAIWAKY